MRHLHIRSVFVWLLVGAGCAAVPAYVRPVVRSWQAERAIARFEAGPSQAGADRLLGLLTKERATAAQGSRILKLLLWPKVTTRPAYPDSETARVALETPFRLNIPNGRIEIQRGVWSGEKHWFNWPGRATSKLTPSAELLSPCPGDMGPGIYHPEIHYQCQFTKSRGGVSFWSRLRQRLGRRFLRRSLGIAPARFEKTYDRHFTVPLTVRIAETGAAEKLQAVSNPRLDKTMRDAFATRPVQSHGVYFTSSGRRHCVRSTEIVCQALPVAIAFKLFLRLPDSHELPQGGAKGPQKIRLRADTSGRFVVQAGPFGLEQPGEYTGTLILRPAPDYAYEDPAIKTIWSGTLEFPISFTISKEPNSP